jgi:uncharacterized protein (DUF433 family)
MSQIVNDAVENGDPRELPAYGVTEAAHYLGIPLATLRSWVCGRYYPTEGGKRFFRPVIELPSKAQPSLSFFNLVEAHVLDAIRREHSIALGKVRTAIRYLQTQFHSKHPLAEHRFQTDGVDLFVEKYGSLIAVSQAGQTAMKEVLQAYLQRIRHDDQGLAIQLFPFVRSRREATPERIVIDPAISFGRPVIAGTGIATSIVAERYKAGESVDELAEDYGLQRPDIEEALRCELSVAA